MKSAGKARSNGLYRHIRTSKEIIRNLLNDSFNYYDKMVRPTWTELMKTPRYQRAACERDKIEREFRRLLDEKLGRKYLELDDALFRVMDDIAEAMYMKGAADREMMIR